MKSLRELSIAGYEKIGQGFACAVYALDDKTIVKVAYGAEPEAYAYYARLMGEEDAEGVQKNIDLMKVYYDALLRSYFAGLSDSESKTVIGRIRSLAYQKMVPFYAKLPLSDEAEKQKNLQSLKEKYFSETKTIPPVREWWREEP